MHRLHSALLFVGLTACGSTNETPLESDASILDTSAIDAAFDAVTPSSDTTVQADVNPSDVLIDTAGDTAIIVTPGALTLTVTRARETRVAGGANGRLVELELALANGTAEAAPLRSATWALQAGTLIYSQFVSTDCPNASLAPSGTLRCAMVWELGAAEVPTELRYASGALTANASVPAVEPRPLCSDPPVPPYSTRVAGNLAPFTLPRCDGTAYSFYNSDYCTARATLLLVDAGWNQPSRLQATTLERQVVQRFANCGLRVLEVLLQDNNSNVPSQSFCEGWVNQYQLTNRVLRDNANTLGPLFPANSLPAQLLLDRSGSIVYRQDGVNETRLIDRIRALLTDAGADVALCEQGPRSSCNNNQGCESLQVCVSATECACGIATAEGRNACRAGQVCRNAAGTTDPAQRRCEAQ